MKTATKISNWKDNKIQEAFFSHFIKQLAVNIWLEQNSVIGSVWSLVPYCFFPEPEIHPSLLDQNINLSCNEAYKYLNQTENECMFFFYLCV